MKTMITENYGGNVYDVARKIAELGLADEVFGIYPASPHGGVVVFKCLTNMAKPISNLWRTGKAGS